jgi:hypothetical protein
LQQSSLAASEKGVKQISAGKLAEWLEMWKKMSEFSSQIS